MTRPQLRFEAEHIGPICSGEKTMTIRYGLGHDFEPGDKFEGVDTRDRVFAVLETATQIRLPLAALAGTRLAGHRDYADESELRSHLERYYDGVRMTAETMLDVVVFLLDAGATVRARSAAGNPFDDFGQWGGKA